MPVNSFENYPMTWKPKRLEGKEPKYRELAKQLERDIKNGTLAEGTKLPPQRELADYLDINLSTVTRAFKICTLDGLLYGETGKGTFVANQSTWKGDNEAENKIDMRYTQSFPEAGGYIRKAAAKIAAKSNLDEILSYRNSGREGEYDRAAVKFLGQMGIEAENILICPCSQNAIATVLAAMFRAGDKIAVDRYTYHNFKSLAAGMSIQLIGIDNDDEGMRPDSLERQCALKNIKGIYIMPVCQNPTAVTMPMKRIDELSEVIKRRRLITIEDAAMLFIGDERPSFYHKLGKRCFLVTGTSKAICEGLRTAVLAYPKDSENAVRWAFSGLSLTASVMDLEIFTELVNTNICLDIMEENRKRLKERNDIFDKYFKRESGYENSLSFYRWIRLPEGSHTAEVLMRCSKKGVLVLPSERFAAGGGESFIRAALSSPRTAEELEEGLSRLKKALEFYE